MTSSDKLAMQSHGRSYLAADVNTDAFIGVSTAFARLIGGEYLIETCKLIYKGLR